MSRRNDDPWSVTWHAILVMALFLAAVVAATQVTG